MLSLEDGFSTPAPPSLAHGRTGWPADLMTGGSRSTGARGGRLASTATQGLGVRSGRRACAGECVIAGAAGTGGRALLRSLARLGFLAALSGLGGLLSGLLIFPDVSARALASVRRLRSVCAGLHAITDRGFGLRSARLISGLAIAGGRSFDTVSVH